MRFLSLLLICLFSSVSYAQQLWIEDFDGTNVTNIPTWTYQDFCTSRDYLDIVCDDGDGCANEINADYVYNGSSGQYLGVRDVDHNGCTGDTNGEEVTFSGIDISSCAFPKILYVCFTVAESRNMNGAFGAEWGTSCSCEDTWDGNSSVQVLANVDGGGFSSVTAIEASVGSDSRPGIDINCDGDAGDTGEPELTDSFVQYCFELPALGSSLDLNIVLVGFNTAGEDVAIDDISVYCETNETTLPAAATTLPSCTPFVASNPCVIWGEDFEGGTASAFDFGCNFTDSRDYLGVKCLDNGACPNGADEMNGDYTYANATGNFLGARDFDGPCGGPSEGIAVTGVSPTIDISTCAAPLYVCFDIAESDSQPREGTDTWDGDQADTRRNSFLTIAGAIDGVSSNLIGFAAVSNNNSGGAVDSDCDGIGEGAPLTPAFTSYCVLLPNLGNNLDLSITIGGLNSDGDDVALDNILVMCTSDPSCLPAAVTATACLDPLPVNLSYFKGELSNGTSWLSWETAQELNNDFFEIQHSSDGRTFSKIGLVEGAGSSNALTNYEFAHKHVLAKDNYYRLKQYDFNGEFEYSNIVHLENEEGREESLIYPNPATNNITFEGSASELNFYNWTGAIVKRVRLDEGITNIDVSQLNAGFYMIEIINKGQAQALKKFVKN